MHPLIHQEDSYDKEDGHRYLTSKPPSLETTWEPVHPSKKSTEEPTSETDPGTSPDPYAPTREDNKGHLAPGDIMKYKKGSDLPRFATLEEHTKESPWGDTCKIRILGQDQ